MGYLAVFVCLCLSVYFVSAVLPLKCSEDEYLDRCINSCQPTCKDPTPMYHKPTKCHFGCVCRPPLVRNTITGKCVCITTCPKPCKDNNAEYLLQGPKCIKTCRNMYTKPKDCGKIAGCFCKPGFVYDEKRKKCIPPEFCSCVQCPKNQVFLEQGYDCRRCGHKCDGTPCMLQKVARCYCIKNYVRTDEGDCIAPEKCPK